MHVISLLHMWALGSYPIWARSNFNVCLNCIGINLIYYMDTIHYTFWRKLENFQIRSLNTKFLYFFTSFFVFSWGYLFKSKGRRIKVRVLFEWKCTLNWRYFVCKESLGVKSVGKFLMFELEIRRWKYWKVCEENKNEQHEFWLELSSSLLVVGFDFRSVFSFYVYFHEKNNKNDTKNDNFDSNYLT